MLVDVFVDRRIGLGPLYDRSRVGVRLLAMPTIDYTLPLRLIVFTFRGLFTALLSSLP